MVSVMIQSLKPFLLVLTLSGVVLAQTAEAGLVKQTVDYSLQKTAFKSYLVYNDSFTGKRPGILVFPEWWGLNDYAKMRADQLADMGYMAMAVDIYSDAKSTQDRKIAGQWAGDMRSSPKLKDYSMAAFNALVKQKLVDPDQMAAIGFCFGGTAVLRLAYSGANLKAAVTFHGGLIAPEPDEVAMIKPKILILHGSKDPVTPQETIDKLKTALDNGKKDWQMILYGGAVHTFSNPAAGTNVSSGSAYNPVAAKRSWKHMKVFFKELFPKNEDEEKEEKEKKTGKSDVEY
jgi:dienelactone hydrolase